MITIPRIRHFISTQQEQDVVVKEYLVAVVALAVVLAVVVVYADMAEAGRVIIPIIALHMQI